MKTLKFLKGLMIALAFFGFFMMLGAIGNDDYKLMAEGKLDYPIWTTIAQMLLGAGVSWVGYIGSKMLNEEIEHEQHIYRQKNSRRW